MCEGEIIFVADLWRSTVAGCNFLSLSPSDFIFQALDLKP